MIQHEVTQIDDWIVINESAAGKYGVTVPGTHWQVKAWCTNGVRVANHEIWGGNGHTGHVIDPRHCDSLDVTVPLIQEVHRGLAALKRLSTDHPDRFRAVYEELKQAFR